MFSFGVISFNQEALIVETLESIKFQIENFGKEEKFEIILGDDCSKDKTIEIASKWLEENKYLFKKVIILTNNYNLGINKNYIKVVNNIKNNFKTIAGDDLFYRHSIFQVLNDFDLVFSLPLAFQFGNIVKSPAKHLLNHYDLTNHHSIIKNIENGINAISAPGVFIKKEILKDESLINFISKFSFSEDIPKWYYLFKIKKEINYLVTFIPYVMYRVSHGISVNKNHPLRQKALEERRIMYESLGINLLPNERRLPKYIDPSRYYDRIKMICRFTFNKSLSEFKKDFSKEEKEAPMFLDYIMNNANKFYKRINEEKVYDTNEQ